IQDELEHSYDRVGGAGCLNLSIAHFANMPATNADNLLCPYSSCRLSGTRLYSALVRGFNWRYSPHSRWSLISLPNVPMPKWRLSSGASAIDAACLSVKAVKRWYSAANSLENCFGLATGRRLEGITRGDARYGVATQCLRRIAETLPGIGD